MKKAPVYPFVWADLKLHGCQEGAGVHKTAPLTSSVVTSLNPALNRSVREPDKLIHLS